MDKNIDILFPYPLQIYKSDMGKKLIENRFFNFFFKEQQKLMWKGVKT